MSKRFNIIVAIIVVILMVTTIVWEKGSINVQKDTINVQEMMIERLEREKAELEERNEYLQSGFYIQLQVEGKDGSAYKVLLHPPKPEEPIPTEIITDSVYLWTSAKDFKQMINEKNQD